MFKQTSVNIIGKTVSSCSKGTAFHQGRVGLVSQSLGLLDEEKSSPSLALRESE